jgi:predicted DNA-binding transcriptional regulator AlpA
MASVLDEVLTVPDVLALGGFSRQTLYNLLKTERFPKPRLLGGLVCVWDRRTVVEALETLKVRRQRRKK